MRSAFASLALVGLTLSGCATTAPPAADPPVLRKVVLRETVGRYNVIYPTFYFQADGGDVVAVHRQIIASDAANRRFNPVSHFDIDADQQRRGAVWVGGWGCGPNPSRTTVRAYLVDRHGRHSNSLDYTIVCKGAKALFGDPERPS